MEVRHAASEDSVAGSACGAALGLWRVHDCWCGETGGGVAAYGWWPGWRVWPHVISW